MECSAFINGVKITVEVGVGVKINSVLFSGYSKKEFRAQSR